MTDHVDIGQPTRVAVGPQTLPGDAYPKVIQDQREMFAKVDRDEIVAHWHEYLATQHNMAPHVDQQARQLVPYISKSRWVADCPECGSGIAMWDENPNACCLLCGTIYTDIRWEPPAVRAEACRLLAARPAHERDWFCHRGESTHRLEVENRLVLGVDTNWRDGLRIPDGLNLPDGILSAHDYLEHLRTVETKAALA